MESRKDEKENRRKRRKRIRGIIQGFRRRVNQICNPVQETADILDRVVEVAGLVRDFLQQEDLLDEDVRRHLQEALDELERVRDGIQPLSDACGRINRSLELADQVLATSSSTVSWVAVVGLITAIAALAGGIAAAAIVMSSASTPSVPTQPIIVDPVFPTPAPTPLPPIFPAETPAPPTPTLFPTFTPSPQPTATPALRPASTPTPAPVGLPPVAEFRATPLKGGCQFRVQFFDLSKNATNYFWDFGDGASSTERDPVHLYARGSEGLLTYTVTLTAGGRGGQDLERKVDYITSQCIL